MPRKLPKRRRRSESFLGIHFDFHAGDDCTEIGRTLTPKMLDEMLRRVKPDYVQCDCKGHRGLSSYPTKVGHPAPGFTRDPLRVWRDATARRGVSLYMHYSGVWDTEAVKRHPSWAQVEPDGKRSKKNTSVFGPYVDKLLIPQMRELCDAYGVDGVWVDGECWATGQDYGRKVLQRFRRETGIRHVPKKPDDPYFFEFTEFCREGFREYLRHYVDAMHAHDPNFEIASNWAFTSHMPEPVTANVDFLSGDYPLQDSVRAARFEARCIMNQGKPWDLMAWSFCGRFREPERSTKTPVQLQQEAAIVLALGGGFQAYFKQKRDGSINPWTMHTMAEVAKFCRARQAHCHRATAVPQIGLLYSTHAFYRMNERMFSPWGGQTDALRGALGALLDRQQSVEVLCEHHLRGRLDEYPLIVIPEWPTLDEAFRDELVARVRRGGSLLVIGPAAAKMFEDELGVELLDQPTTRARFIDQDGRLFCLHTEGQDVKAKPGVKKLAEAYDHNDFAGEPRVVATSRRLGKGRIAGLYVNCGHRYSVAGTSGLRDLFGRLARHLMPGPIVEVTGSHHVDVAVMRQPNGRLAVNLVNTAGPHADPNVYVFDEVPPVGPLEVSIRLPERPRRVLRQPGGREVDFTWSKGAARVTLDQLAVHDVLVVEPDESD